MMRYICSLIGDDGIFWAHASPDRPWHGAAEDFADVYGQVRMMRAILIWQQFTGDPNLTELADRLVHGHDKMVVHKDDYCYIPYGGGTIQADYLDNTYSRSGWRSTNEPRHERDSSEEGSVFLAWGAFPGPFALWHQMTGHARAMSLATEFVNFLTKPKLWGISAEPNGMVGADHAHGDGHFHGRMEVLRALLEYAITTNDARLKQFVRDGYEWTRQYGIPRIGWSQHQACGPPRLTALAVKLSDAGVGVGDFWEDVDCYIRNQGSESQILRPDYLSRFSEGASAPELRPGWDTTENVLESTIGDWSNYNWPTHMMGCPTPPNGERANFFCHICCTSHGSMGLFYAWEGAMRCSDGVARINLLLNRASPWLDVDSHLPYEGKVVIRNKTARRMLVRIPLWVDRKAVRCRVDDREVRHLWIGNYLEIGDLNPKDVVTIQFPMVESRERYTLYGQEYTLDFRGNTLIDISPRHATGEDASNVLYPLYERDHLRRDVAPTTRVERYVTEAAVRW